MKIYSKIKLPYLATLFIGGSIAGMAHSANVQVRTTGFDYDKTTGVLVKKIQEPADATHCVAYVFSEINSFGDANKVTSRPCNGSSNNIALVPAESTLATDANQWFIERSTSYTRTSDNRFISSSKNQEGHTDSYEFNSKVAAEPTKKTEQLDASNVAVTLWKFDDLGRKLFEVKADNNGTKWSYDFCQGVNDGPLICPTVGSSVAIYAVTTTPIQASNLGSPRSLDSIKTAPNGPYTRHYYDGLGRVIRTETQGFDGNGFTSKLVIQDTKRNSKGDITDKSFPYYSGDTPRWITYTYDVLHRVKTITQPVGANNDVVKTISYSGLQTTTTDPITPGSAAGSKTVEVKNLIGLQESVTDAKGGKISHKYDAFGNRVETVDPSGNVLSARYDLYGRKITSYDPDLGVWAYTYDALGQLKTQTDAKSKVAYLSYDKLGRLTQRSENDLLSKWSYDSYSDGSACTYGRGQLCESQVLNGNPSKATFARQYIFDNYGRPSTTKVNVGADSPLSFVTKTEYDANGRISKITYPRPPKGDADKAQLVQYNYSTLGYLQSVQDMRGNVGTALWTAKAMDAAGHFTKFAYGNNVVTDSTYFDDGRLNSRKAGIETNNTNDNLVQNISHSYDQAGNLINRLDSTINGVSTDYTYDELYRVKTEKRTGGALSATQNLAWDYDALGNMISRTENGQVNSYNYPSSGSGSKLPHAVANVGGMVNNVILPTYIYDDNGNLTTGGGRTVVWTTNNMVSSITKGSTQLSYTYDAEHNRAQEVLKQNGTTQRTTTYVGPLYEEESGASGLVKKFFVNAAGTNVAVITNINDSDTGWSVKYWHKDNLGSNVAVTDASHAVVERLAYEPYGKRRNVSGHTDVNGTLVAASTDRGYTEHEHMDEVGLVNMNGRVYDPALGRFMSADTIVPNPSFTQDYNRYSYTLNNPLTFTDPDGHTPVLSEDALLSSSFSQRSIPDSYFPINSPPVYSGGSFVSFSMGSNSSGNSISVSVSSASITRSSDGLDTISLSRLLKNNYRNISDWGHNGLTVLGAVPVVGTVADVFDAVWTLGEYATGFTNGKVALASVSAVALNLAPGPGDAGATALKFGARNSDVIGGVAAKGVHPSTPVGRTGSWQDTSQFTGNTVKANRELNVAGARAGAPPVNSPATIGSRDFSGHALDRMQQRGYVPSVVEDAIRSGTRTPSYGGASSYYSPSNNLTVIVNDATGKVVTVRGGP